jgi:molecular chaperone DnaK
VSTAIIERNTTVPTPRSQIFSTTEDAQTIVRIHVVQGEREMAADNKTLGRFELVGIPPAPRGVPQIEVTFEIDADGVVKVSARDLGTGQSQEIQVTGASGLKEEEVDALVREAEEHGQADADRREMIDLRNTADGLVYSTERTLDEFKEHIAETERPPLLEMLAKTRGAMQGDDVAALRSAVDELSALTYKMTESLYAELEGGDSSS